VQNIRVVHHHNRPYVHLAGYPPRQERLRSRPSADFREFGPFGLKLAPDDLAGGLLGEMPIPACAQRRYQEQPAPALAFEVGYAVLAGPLGAGGCGPASQTSMRPRALSPNSCRRTAVWPSCRAMACTALVASSETSNSVVSCGSSDGLTGPPHWLRLLTAHPSASTLLGTAARFQVFISPKPHIRQSMCQRRRPPRPERGAELSNPRRQPAGGARSRAWNHTRTGQYGRPAITIRQSATPR
jgi:hypothetical protein